MSNNTFIQLTASDLWNIRNTRVVYNQAPLLLQKLVQYSYNIVRDHLAEELVGTIKEKPLLGATTFWAEEDLPELKRRLASEGFSKHHFVDMLESGEYTDILDSELIENTLVAAAYKDDLFSLREITNITNFSTINPDNEINNHVSISYKQKTILDNVIINMDLIRDTLDFAEEIVGDG